MVSRVSAGLAATTSLVRAGAGFFLRAADAMRPLECPMVVLDVAVEAVWRMVEGFVGGGVALGRERSEEVLGNGRDVFGGGLGAVIPVVGFGRDRATAADLDVTVDGPLETGFFLGDLCGVDKAAMVF